MAFCVELNVTFLNMPNKHKKNSVTFVDSLTVSVSSALILCIFSPPQSFTRCITYTQAKTLRGRKDTLAQEYFYWGAIAPSPPGIDATACENSGTDRGAVWARAHPRGHRKDMRLMRLMDITLAPPGEYADAVE